MSRAQERDRALVRDLCISDAGRRRFKILGAAEKVHFATCVCVCVREIVCVCVCAREKFSLGMILRAITIIG
jgi:hypothetical protein